MTNEQAIKWLKGLKANEILSATKEALDMAIESLEERPQGDLISREALKKALKSNCDTLCNDKNTNWCEHCCPLNDFEDLIDNAPTAIVESDILYLCDHKKCGENFNCYECNHTSDIRHAINFDLLEFPRSVFVERARPQGEWKLIRVADHCGIHDSFVCPFCNYEREYRKKNFCEECGADLRGDNDDG